MKLLDKVFGSYSQRQIRKLMPIVKQIEEKEAVYTAMSDEELRGMTDRLKARLAAGETLDDILPDAFATVREADARVLGKRPFRVQLMGGIVLHQGRVAEMKTGEGKTLVATLPAYLNALTGEGVHVVTVNEYLARVGAEEMGRVYGFLGMTTGIILHGQTKEEKQLAYRSDITYGTNNEFGFDYLRDNMAVQRERLVQRDHVFAIVDEVDSILIDEARTPLIISGEGEESTDLYDRADACVRTMREFRIKELDDTKLSDDLSELEEGDSDDPLILRRLNSMKKKNTVRQASGREEADYIVDEKARTTVLTESGISKVERFFKIENLSDPENATLAHHINQALRAHGVMRSDVDYIVKDNQVLIVDSFTGRIMPGRRFSDGLHQAIEAKEHVKIQKENKTLATITFQNYFRMYRKLSGMTGTALTEEEEFREIYNLDVVEIPTNRPMIRLDRADAVYKNQKGKMDAIVAQIVECHEKGQPVLAGTASVEKSEALSRRLKLEGIEHTVLNAKYHEKEAEIVARAGEYGKVTIATNMAGRGTDILLGGNPEFLAKQDMRRDGYSEDVIGLAVGASLSVPPEVLAAREVYQKYYAEHKAEIEPLAAKVREAGGLYIVGTERHESRRIDNQLRGRSGRQGDPGESRFFLALDDDLMRLFGSSEKIVAMIDRLGLPDDQPISAGILSNSIERAQKTLEGQNFQRRKTVLMYDDVMNQQRTVIYKQRREVLDGADLQEMISKMITTTVAEAVESFTSAEDNSGWNLDGLRSYFLGTLCTLSDLRYTPEQIEALDRETLIKELTEKALALYHSKDALFEPYGVSMREVERIVLLRNVDTKWMEHLDAMDDLKDSVGLQSYAQRDPINTFRLEGADMFDEMSRSIREDTVRAILSVRPQPQMQLRREEVAHVTGEGFAAEEGQPARTVPVRPGPWRQPQPQPAGAQGALSGQLRGTSSTAQKPTPAQAAAARAAKVGRNDPCPCGSGLKYKKCCGRGDASGED